jgi:hypothetical protein
VANDQEDQAIARVRKNSAAIWKEINVAKKLVEQAEHLIAESSKMERP